MGTADRSPTRHGARVDLSGGLDAVRAARCAVRCVLDGWGFTDEQWLDDAELVAAELAANAVLHGGGYGSLEVSAGTRHGGGDEAATIAVVDSAEAAPPRPVPSRSVDAAHGRGLLIVAAVSAEWGWRSRIGGKQVWARLRPHPSPAKVQATGTGTGRAREGSADDRIDRILRSRTVQTVFQPLVDLDSGATVGFEALTRGPAGSPLESPSALFDAAYRAGRVAELDWVARAGALRAALTADLHPDLSWFVNAEPASMHVPCPPDLLPTVTAATDRLRVVLEVTERAVAADPAGLLAGVNRARDAGWSIALDDVGAEPASLAVMPFLRPDVIKLDLRLVHDRPSMHVARTINAVLAQAERTGATILAEGIETPEHADIARAMGAVVGQGWLFGRPGPLPEAPGPVSWLPPAHRSGRTVATGATPFATVAGHRPVNRTRKDLLLPMSIHLEHTGLDPDEPLVLLGSFQHSHHFTHDTRRRYTDLATTAAFVGALGAGMPAEPAPGVRGAHLADDDPLRGEWNVIAIGPRFAGALVARDCGDTGPEAERRFDYAMTHDRDLVIAAATTLLDRLAPA